MPISTGVVIAALALLLYKVTSLVPFSPIEFAQQLGSSSVNSIKDESAFAPIKALQLIILKFTEDDVYIRLASVAAAAASAWLLYVMLRKWHTQRVSLLATAMFITSTYFLQHGRSANLEVMYLSAVPALLLICMWLLAKKDDKKLPFAAVLLGLVLYIPGAWLLALAGSIFLRKILIKTIRHLSKPILAISLTAFIATILPLIYSFALRPSQVVSWLGINTDQTVHSLGKHLLDIPRQLIYSGPGDPAVWLVGTPIFEIFSLAMIILGLFAYRTGYYPAREKLVLGALIIAATLVVFGNVATIALLIPVFYILIANGLSYMLQSWFTVFPRNPVARPLGIALLIFVVACSCAYQLQRYYVAWPNAEATQKALTSER